MYRVNTPAIITVATFLLTALWFFFPIGKEDLDSLLFDMRLALPAAILAAGCFASSSKLAMCAFLFCALGDAMGVLNSFEGQMGGFAIAHICFILLLAKDIRIAALSPVTFVGTALLCSLPLIPATLKVLPAVHDLSLRIGCIVYALLLTTTMLTGILRYLCTRAGGNPLTLAAALGGVSFLASDFILAWNKFTAHIPNASLLIMTTYYAALLLLFTGTLRNNKTKGETLNTK